MDCDQNFDSSNLTAQLDYANKRGRQYIEGIGCMEGHLNFLKFVRELEEIWEFSLTVREFGGVNALTNKYQLQCSYKNCPFRLSVFYKQQIQDDLTIKDFFYPFICENLKYITHDHNLTDSAAKIYLPGRYAEF